MKVTIEEFNQIHPKALALRGKLQQAPASVLLTAETLVFYDANNKEIGYVNVGSGQGWIQKASGGSETVRL